MVRAGGSLLGKFTMRHEPRPSGLLDMLPRGGQLPTRSWRRRHRGIVALVWLHVLGFAAYAFFNPDGPSLHNGSEVALIGLLASLASWPRIGRNARTAMGSIGLIASSGLLVHVSDGLIEMHFHFFVAVAVIALYEQWLPFLLALGYVLLDHGVMGTLAPELVYNHADAQAEPGKWALIHASFVLAASTASIVHWRLNETERLRATNEHARGVRAQAAREAAEAEVAARKQVEAALHSQAAVLAEQARLLDLAQDAILVWELQSGAIRFWNRGAEALYGWSRDEVLGRTPQAILRTEFPRPLAEMNAQLVASGRWDGELVHSRRDGTPVVVASRWALQTDVEGKPDTVLAINSNITDQKHAQAALEHQALHDSLTGLPNRTLFGDRLQQALARAARAPTPTALLMLDLDRFKDVNDTLGHEWGDRLLREVGARLLTQLREMDTLARLGGDEFAVFLPETSASAAEIVARRLLATFDLPFAIADSHVAVGVSIGIANAPEHGADPETLLRCADVAMYVAKRNGSGCEFYSPEQDQHSRDRLGIASELRGALEGNELVLYYQPKLRCSTSEVAGVEALVRWEHPQRGLIPPDHFIPIAEQTALIGLIGRRVLDLGLAQCRAWSASGLNVPVAVNLSMREVLDPELPSYVEALLESHGVDGSMLRVEITETSLMADPVRARCTLERLRRLGVNLSVDDFGTGYSSLRYLQQLPVDELKIDRSFVREMMNQESDRTIVRSTIELAHGLGLNVVAEGVEDVAGWTYLARGGCDQAQGYYVSKPLPADAATEWLFAQSTVRSAA
jgi:diguanylate cyclase (GGDEF)-like protein/PAS domain S-box-containing protein